MNPPKSGAQVEPTFFKALEDCLKKSDEAGGSWEKPGVAGGGQGWPGWPGMAGDGPGWPGMVVNCWNLTRMDPGWTEMAENGWGQSKMSSNCSKRPGTAGMAHREKVA